MPRTHKPFPAVPVYKSIVNIPQFVRNPIPVFTALAEEYGSTFLMNVGGANRRSIISIDPDFIQAVLQKHHRKYNKSAIQTHILARYVGKGLLTSEGDYWLRQRRLIQPGFHKSGLSDLMDIMNVVIDEQLPRLEDAAARGEPVEVTEFSTELAFNIVARALFSTSVSEEELDRLGNNISTIQRFIVRQVRQPYLNFWFRISGKIEQHVRLADNSNSIILRYIRERREGRGAYSDLLDMLIKARYEDTGQGMTDRQLLDECLILFVAGHETSANALAWTFYLLSTHPGAARRLQQELDEVMPEGRPAFEDLPRLDYTRQVVQESMRLYPPAWVMDRVAVEDDEINGCAIARGTMIIPFVYGVHHSKELWPEPEAFRPERFEKAAMKDRHPYAYLPFGGGPRLCIGNNFAMMEIQLILARVLAAYDVLPADGPPVEMLPLVTLRPKNGIRLRFRKREVAVKGK